MLIDRVSVSGITSLRSISFPTIVIARPTDPQPVRVRSTVRLQGQFEDAVIIDVFEGSGRAERAHYGDEGISGESPKFNDQAPAGDGGRNRARG